jgi:tetratricopeptide (TPR) repeat protein
MRRALLLLSLILLSLAASLAQDPDIGSYTTRIEKGDAAAVRLELPTLLANYPNNPGVLYLQGMLTTDGTEAVRIYQSIVDNFPKSEWADDALYKVYQFYYAIGLYRTAEIKLSQLKADYPNSKYIATVERFSINGLPEEKEPPETTKTVAASPIQNSPVPSSADKPVMPETEPQQPASEDRGQYTLQVGAYSQQVNAEKQKLFFEDLGYAVEVINKVRDSRPLFVVLVGDYRTPDEAKAKGEEFKKNYNINSMMVTR